MEIGCPAIAATASLSSTGAEFPQGIRGCELNDDGAGVFPKSREPDFVKSKIGMLDKKQSENGIRPRNYRRPMNKIEGYEMKTMTAFKLAAFGFSSLGLVACVEDTGGSSGPSVAEQACLRDVTRVTNNPDVVLLSSSYSEAGTEVIAGVGEQRAQWRCIGYSDGTTGGIESLVNEGTL
ncbi:hypothetical protein FGK63_15715 [Ruegeria sediminis]|uniref:Uncharacterized protein n=1 Tax=Ruegeria sediminis TaxID=2583820 RepID=A0ABY2WU05_9RHOB|nr:hypothetical protein [Ruegeria sediminis]TMV05493.1 hypothetical protein FGK63_15715 [Ruegeria sediminis]